MSPPLFSKPKGWSQEKGKHVLPPCPAVNQSLQSFPQRFPACVKSDPGDVVSLEQGRNHSFSEGPGTLLDSQVSSTEEVGIFRQGNWPQIGHDSNLVL